MTKIQVTIDEHLLNEVDNAVADLQTDRSTLVCEALRVAVRRFQLSKLEARHAAGYARHPGIVGEFDGWEDKQVWGNE